MTDKKKAFISIFARAFLTAATGPVTKIGITQIPPLTFAFIRFFLASFWILPILVKRKDVLKDTLRLTPISILATANIILFVLGVKLTTATISQFLYAGIPVLTPFFLYLLYKKRVEKQKIVGIIVGFIGVAIVVFLPIIEKGEQFAGNMMGNLLILGGVVFSSLYEIFSKKAQEEYSPFEVTTAFIFVSTIVLFPFFIWDLTLMGGWWDNINLAGITALGYVVIFTTIIGYLLHQYAIKHGGVIFASMFYYLFPIFGYVTSFILLGERLTLGLIIGATLALLGIFLVTSKS